MLKKRVILPIMILMLFFSISLIIPNNARIVFAKTTTLAELKKIKKENEKKHEKCLPGPWVSLYKCRGKVIRWDESKSNTSSSYMTYYKLKADGQTLKLICTIWEKSYFDEKASAFKSKYKIQRAGSSKYVKLSKKKFKKLQKKYKVIKHM